MSAEPDRDAFEIAMRAHIDSGSQAGQFDAMGDFWFDRLDDGRYEIARMEDAWLGYRLATLRPEATERPAAEAVASSDGKRDPHFGGTSYEASMLRDLLAVIHRDGGHFVAEHGLDKAIDAAHVLLTTALQVAAPTDAESSIIPPIHRAQIERILEFQKNDKRTEEQKIEDGASFIMGPGGDEGTRIVQQVAAPTVSAEDDWRVSKSGYSIRTGWGDEKRILAQIPATTPKEMVQAWIDAASDIVDAHNKERHQLAATLATAERERRGPCGLSWDGFNVWGDGKSIQEVKEAIHVKGQQEEWRAMILAERKRAETAEQERDKAVAVVTELVACLDDDTARWINEPKRWAAAWDEARSLVKAAP